MDAHSLICLGSLSLLPPEVRNLVYRHVFLDEYYYNPPSSSIGLLGTSKIVRHEAGDTLYSHSRFHFEFKCSPLGPSHELVKRLDHVEIAINMDHYSFELFPGKEHDVDLFYKDILCKLACTDRVRKTCHIVFRRYFYRISWGRIPFLQHLRRLSAFRTITLELECLAIDFEDVHLREKDSLQIRCGLGDGYLGSYCHKEWVAAMERQRQRLRTYLEVTLGAGRSYDRGNFRCLEFHPQSTRL